MTHALPVAFYLNDVDGDVARRGPAGLSFASASDIEARIADAHARGVLEGRAAAQVDTDAALARQTAQAEQKLKAERQKWCDEEGQRLGGQLTRSLEDLEQRMAAQIAQILRPFLAEEVRTRAMVQLSATLNDMLSKGDYAAISVSGPYDLIEAIKSRLKGDGEAIAFTEGEGPNVTITADETILEARIGAWTGAIQGDGA